MLLVVFLIIKSGAAEVASAMLVLGWWLVPISLYHLAPLSFDALSWRELLPASSRPGFLGLLRIRWIRESINSLLPVAGVGGDVAGARLVHKAGVPGPQAAASMVVDITVGTGTQLIFVLAGVALLAARSNSDASAEVARATLIGVGVFATAIAAFVLVQHNSMFGLFAHLARRVAPEKWLSVFAGHASAIDAAVMATYRRRSAFLAAVVLRLMGWVAGAGETWLVMYFLGRPLSVTDAFILESSQFRRPRGGVHGAGGVRRPRERHCGVRRAVRVARGHGVGDFPVETGPRAGSGPAGPRGLAVG